MSNVLRPAFVKSIQRMECTKCGAEANASCNCGVTYKPAAERVREYDEANPGKSTRAAAADLGVSKDTVNRARGVSHETPEAETVVGLDGKQYPARAEKRDADHRRARADCPLKSLDNSEPDEAETDEIAEPAVIEDDLLYSLERIATDTPPT
jgi:hypothetical protein